MKAKFGPIKRGPGQPRKEDKRLSYSVTLRRVELQAILDTTGQPTLSMAVRSMIAMSKGG